MTIKTMTIKTMTIKTDLKACQSAVVPMSIFAMNTVEPKQNSIKTMDSELTFEQTVERVSKINNTLREMNYDFEQIDAFWANVFKKCKAKEIVQEPEKCPHDISLIDVIFSCVTCEVTRTVCKSCRAQLTEPKIEC